MNLFCKTNVEQDSREATANNPIITIESERCASGGAVEAGAGIIDDKKLEEDERCKG